MATLPKPPISSGYTCPPLRSLTCLLQIPIWRAGTKTRGQSIRARKNATEEESQLIYPERKPGKHRRKPDHASKINLSSLGDGVSISIPNPIYPGWRVDSASPAFFYMDWFLFLWSISFDFLSMLSNIISKFCKKRFGSMKQ